MSSLLKRERYVLSQFNLLGLGDLGVNNLSGVLDNLGDLAFGSQSSERLLSKRGSHFHSLRSNGGGNDLVAWDLLVEEGQVDKLVSHFTLAPLLLFTLATAHGSFGLGLLGLLDLRRHSNLDSLFSVSST